MCGDGANDCGALKAAHTGISLSDAESSVASPFTSKNPNITCVPDIIKEGRAALVTSFGIFKYMAAYSLCQFISVMILYSIDSSLTDIQFLYIDLFIIAVFAFFFGKTHSYTGKLVKEKPLSSLISFTPICSLIVQVLLVIGFQVGSFEYLKQQDWFVPFNSEDKEDKDSVSCVENYTIFTVSSFQYLILAVVFSKGKPYRQSIFSNYGFIISAVILTGFSVYMALDPTEFLVDQFELILPEVMNFRLYLLAYALANFVLSMLLEIYLIEHIIFKKFRFKWHDIYKSRRKFLAVERDLHLDTKWPMLSSDFRSAASPITFTPNCTAEIVVEKRKSFEKNHILSSILNENGTPGGDFQQMNPKMLTDSTHLNVADAEELTHLRDVVDPVPEQPKSPFEQLESPFDEPEPVFVQAESPLEQPKLSFSEQPKLSLEQPKLSFSEQPKLSLDQPKLSFSEQPKLSLDQPKLSFSEQPKLSLEQPHLSSEQPNLALTQSDSPSSIGASPESPKSPVSAEFESVSTPDSVIGIGNFESFAEVHRSEDAKSVTRSRKSSALEMNELEFR